MFAATSLGIFLIPVFYVVVRRIFHGKVKQAPTPQTMAGHGGAQERTA
jgi:hypothetical protein